MIQEQPAAITQDGPLLLRDVLQYAKQNGELGFLHNAIRATLIKQHAARLNISVSVDELQETADNIRVELGLFTEQETVTWLDSHQLSLDDLEARAHHKALREKLSQHITNPQIEPYFQEHRASLETFSLSHIQVTEEGVARELHLLITEDGEDFYSLAREYSEDESTRMAGGFMGTFTRRELHPLFSSALLHARAGQLIEPLQIDGKWRLLKLESRSLAVLDLNTRAQLRELLFSQWLEEKARGVEVTLFGSSR